MLDGERRGPANVIVGEERLGKGDVRMERFFELCKFKDPCFPPRYDGRIKIKVSSSDIKPPTAQKIS